MVFIKTKSTYAKKAMMNSKGTRFFRQFNVFKIKNCQCHKLEDESFFFIYNDVCILFNIKGIIHFCIVLGAHTSNIFPML